MRTDDPTALQRDRSAPTRPVPLRESHPDRSGCPMTSFRQIEANRRNALKSTGPNTEEGKHRSRQNAVRHGLCAETVVEIVEDIDDYRGFEAAVIADYDARTAVERELVLRLASLLWRLRRATAIETDLLRIQAEILRDRRPASPHRSNDVACPVRRAASDFQGSESDKRSPRVVILPASIFASRAAAGQFGATYDPMFPASCQSRKWRFRTTRKIQIDNREASREDGLPVAVSQPSPLKRAVLIAEAP